MYNMPNSNPYYQQYAGGGSVKHGLAAAAEQLRQRGRGGDTILAHINPQEAGILKLLGGAGTINPQTGLPEFINIGRELGNLGRGIEKGVRSIGSSIDDAIIQPVLGAANDIAEALGPVGQIAAAYFGGPIGAGIYAGFAAPGDDFNLKRAATAAALTYAGGQLAGPSGAAGTEGAGGISGIEGFAADPVAAAEGLNYVGNAAAAAPSGIGALETAVSSVPNWGANVTSQIPPGVVNPMPAPPVAVPPPPPPSVGGFEANMAIPGASYIQAAPVSTPTTIIPGTAAGTTPTTTSSLANLAEAATEQAIKSAMKDPIKTALGATSAYGTLKSYQETKAQREAVERELAKQEAKRAADKARAEEIMKEYPLRYSRLTAEDVRRMGLAAGGPIDGATFGGEVNTTRPPLERGFGGLLSLAKGGMLPPRFLSGGGDGMSDSIPANIEGRQEARLADGEFVIPADVVSHLGNGSSKAGAKKLYAMMDRVRQARTGKSKQAPEINAKRLMPV